MIYKTTVPSPQIFFSIWGDIRGAILALLLLLTSSAFAASGLSFLEIPVGAREGALGGAGAALISGPTSSAHNPAATAFSERGGFVFMTNKQFGDTRAQFFGLSLKTRKLMITPHFWGTRVSNIEYRESPTRHPISSFDATNSALGLSLGFAAKKDLAFGVTARYLHSKILFESADGYAFDAGTLWRTPVAGLSLAAAVNHLGHVNEYIEESVTLPTTLRGAATYEKPIGGAGSFLLTAEGQAVTENSPIFRGGVEYRAPKILALRLGMVEGLEAQGISLGFGLSHKMIHLDYAFIPYREELGEGHRFALGLDL